MSEKSSFQTLALAVRSLLHEATGLNETDIIIGPPHEAVKHQEGPLAYKSYLSIFFYRIGYSGFPTDATVDDPLYLHAFCLITALGGRPPGGTPPGETELSLMGAVAECFHKTPVLKLKNNGGIQPQLQIVPSQLTLDDINHLWATQNNTPYRLSLAYEFALLPVPLASRAEKGPRVGAISLSTQSTEFSPLATPERHFFMSQVPGVTVDTERPDWAPHICLLDGETPRYSLMLKARPAQVPLVVLGDSTETKPLSLEWEVWDTSDSKNRHWKTGLPGGTCSPAAAKLSKATAIQIKVPDALGSNSGQALLRVTRRMEFQGKQQTLVSNPVLITVGVNE